MKNCQDKTFQFYLDQTALMTGFIEQLMQHKLHFAYIS
jgi:hypothetical protein